MKRMLMIKKKMKGQELQLVDLSLVKGATRRDKSTGMSVRESTRIHEVVDMRAKVITHYEVAYWNKHHTLCGRSLTHGSFSTNMRSVNCKNCIRANR